MLETPAVAGRLGGGLRNGQQAFRKPREGPTVSKEMAGETGKPPRLRGRGQRSLQCRREGGEVGLMVTARVFSGALVPCRNERIICVIH